MCLITFNWRNHDTYHLILVANRDEFFERPSQSLHQWSSGFYGGKDLKSGGTWMGMHPNGRFAAITNFRDLAHLKANPVSRGKLVRDFLEGKEDPYTYLSQVQAVQENYDGFNLLVASGKEMFYLSNYGKGIQRVSPGTHGISNDLLNTPWPKVEKAKNDLRALLRNEQVDPDSLIQIHMSKETQPEANLPDTGLPLEKEKALSAQFIRLGDEYGTVNISVLLWKKSGEVTFLERETIPEKEGFRDTKVTFKAPLI